MNMLIHLLVTARYFRLILYLVFRYFQSKTDGFLSVWSWVQKLISWCYFSEIQHCHCASCKGAKTPKGKNCFSKPELSSASRYLFLWYLFRVEPPNRLGKKFHFPTSLQTLKMTKLPHFPLFLGSLFNWLHEKQSTKPKATCRWLVPVPCTCRWLDNDEWYIINTNVFPVLSIHSHSPHLQYTPLKIGKIDMETCRKSRFGRWLSLFKTCRAFQGRILFH